MADQTTPTFSLYISLLALALLLTQTTAQFIRFADAGQRRIHVPDELADVIDDEEDDDWKNWGKKLTPSPNLDLHPSDLEKMEVSQIQAEMMKRHAGPVFGFVKFKLGVQRSPESVSEIATKWTKVLKTGGIELKFMGIDLSTIMFTLERGQDMEELKDFILDQPDAYEIKIGDRVFRRPGDPPLEQVLEKLHGGKDRAYSASSEEEDKHEEEL
ncbi:hypothetical protein Nepgr_002344 [Nepenthes gracilis]|uniref:Mesoderm development candidate 2 n=1 Tax=Nepenthes gracilis TaxID=150966 RepID=A0AAD3P7Q8_NEPGR|nr:hypothetical protein Nepgr_002344 [Nepenthes gracilis]